MTNELPGIKDIAWASLGTQLRDECAFSRRPGERRDPYAAAGVLRGAVRRLSRDNQSLWLWAFAGTTVESFREKIRSAAKLCLHRAPYLDRFVIGIDLDIAPAHYRSVGDVVFQFHPMRQPDR
jgi:hypothetical protein